MKTTKILFKGVLAFSVGFTTIVGSVVPMIKPVRAAEKEESYTQYVDPFVCTDVDYGQLFPGSVVPNGLVKLSPDTYPHNTLDHAGYDYSKDQIQGFSHTRIEGVGGQGAGGDVLVTPTYVEYTKRPNYESRAMKYTKEDESAKPGYYSVKLSAKSGVDENAKEDSNLGKIHAEMTTDQRTGFHRYTFPKAGSVNILADLNFTYHGTDIRNATLDVLEENETTTALGGKFSGRNVSGNGKYTMYFYMETNKPANNVKTWNGNTLTEKKHQKGNDLGAILNFDVEDNEEIMLKVSISPISVEQAKIDMHNEIDDWNFDATYERADDAWNDVLGKVRIETSEKSDPTGELKKLFYTHLYHMFMTPVNATSTTGTFRGTDGKIHEANDYTHYDSWTLWDDYRKYPMIGLIMPDTYKDMVKSIADALDYGIVTWSHDKQPVPNVRTEHAVALLADGVAKGFTDIDNLEEAYEEAKKIANNVITPEIEEIGYVPNRVDRTIEYAYDDWCLSIIADALGKEDEAQHFLERSMNYKNTFRKEAVQSPFSDKKLGLLWNRDKNGNWLNQDPTSGGTGLYQGTMWQYTWYGSNDINGLMELMGGKEATLEALEYLFGMQDPDDPKGMQHNAANEVELHAPYLFNFVGRPDLTQHWVREIYTRETWNSNYASGTQTKKQKMYKLSPQGYLETMDDDAGTMAMMFVSAAMGIFPMTPGDPTFQIGSPFFEKVTLDVGNGKTFTIEANNVSDENEYIQSATFNGKDFNRTWLDYSEITRGGVLSLEMGNKPSDWAKDGVTAKSSSDMAPTDYSDNDEISYSTGMFEESEVNDGSINDKITISLKTNEFEGDINEDLTALGRIKISNVPKGMKASAVKVDKNKVEISLSGKAERHGLTDSISNMKIEITDDATVTPINDSVRKVKDNIRIMFNDDKLSYSTMKFKEGKNDDGSIADTATITLTGNATFTGEVNEDFIATKKAELVNVPEGISPKMVKVDDRTLVLSFEGKATKHDADVEISLSFTDKAFNGTKASEIENSACSGMTAMLLDFDYDHTSLLRNAITEAEYIRKGVYTQSSYDALMDAVETGKQILAKEKPTSKEIEEAVGNITEAKNALSIPNSQFQETLRLEAEKSDINSGNGLKNESINLGGTYDGAWIKYNDVDFGNYEADKIEVTYSTRVDACAEDARIEIRENDVNGELLGTVQMPLTGGWGDWQTASAELTKPLTGVHNLCFVLRGSTNESRIYIANVDCMQFIDSNKPLPSDEGESRIEAEDFTSNSGGSLKAENSSDLEGNTLGNIGGTYNGAWLRYDANFGSMSVEKLTVRYSANVSRCADDARMEVRLNNNTGELLGTVNLPLTSNWNDYQEVTIDLNKALTGNQTLCFVLLGDTSAKPYIANLDYMEFSENTALHIEAEDISTWSEKELKVENSQDNEGNSLINVGGARDGAWLAYNDVTFNGETEISVRYSHNPGTAGPNSRIDIYLDDMNGNPIGSIDLPTTNGWANYTLTSTTLAEPIEGTHTIYMVLHTGNSGWVANLDWFEIAKSKAEVDKSSLQALYDEYGHLIDQNNLYHHVGFNIFKSVVLDVEKVLENKDATAKDVRIATNDFEKAIKTLQYQIAFDLHFSVVEAEPLEERDYTSDSYSAYMNALEVARNIPDGSTYEEFENAYNVLMESHSKLTRLNRENLRLMIEKAESIDLNQYQDEGKAEFKKALEEAKNIYGQVSLTQAQVDEVTATLDNAIQRLKLIPETVSKEELKALIDEVLSLDKTLYTKDSWSVFQKALDNAIAVYVDENATKEEVDQAVKTLIDAKNQLVLAKDNGDTGKTEDKPGTGSSGNNEETTEKSDEVNTGITSQTSALLAIVIASGAAFVYVNRRKHLNK